MPPLKPALLTADQQLQIFAKSWGVHFNPRQLDKMSFAKMWRSLNKNDRDVAFTAAMGGNVDILGHPSGTVGQLNDPQRISNIIDVLNDWRNASTAGANSKNLPPFGTTKVKAQQDVINNMIANNYTAFDPSTFRLNERMQYDRGTLQSFVGEIKDSGSLSILANQLGRTTNWSFKNISGKIAAATPASPKDAALRLKQSARAIEIAANESTINNPNSGVGALVGSYQYLVNTKLEMLAETGNQDAKAIQSMIKNHQIFSKYVKNVPGAKDIYDMINQGVTGPEFESRTSGSGWERANLTENKGVLGTQFANTSAIGHLNTLFNYSTMYGAKRGLGRFITEMALKRQLPEVGVVGGAAIAMLGASELQASMSQGLLGGYFSGQNPASTLISAFRGMVTPEEYSKLAQQLGSGANQGTDISSLVENTALSSRITGQDMGKISSSLQQLGYSTQNILRYQNLLTSGVPGGATNQMMQSALSFVTSTGFPTSSAGLATIGGAIAKNPSLASFGGTAANIANNPMTALIASTLTGQPFSSFQGGALNKGIPAIMSLFQPDGMFGNVDEATQKIVASQVFGVSPGQFDIGMAHPDQMASAMGFTSSPTSQVTSDIASRTLKNRAFLGTEGVEGILHSLWYGVPNTLSGSPLAQAGPIGTGASFLGTMFQTGFLPGRTAINQLKDLSTSNNLSQEDVSNLQDIMNLNPSNGELQEAAKYIYDSNKFNFGANNESGVVDSLKAIQKNTASNTAYLSAVDKNNPVVSARNIPVASSPSNS